MTHSDQFIALNCQVGVWNVRTTHADFDSVARYLRNLDEEDLECITGIEMEGYETSGLGDLRAAVEASKRARRAA